MLNRNVALQNCPGLLDDSQDVVLPAGEKNELLPDQEVEGDGPGLLREVMLENPAVHLQPLTLTTAKKTKKKKISASEKLFSDMYEGP